MELQKIVTYLLDDVDVSKTKVADLLGVDTKTVTTIKESKDEYKVVKIPIPKVMRSGT